MHCYLPDEIVNNVSGVDINCDEGREGTAVKVGQGPPDHAGEAPQLGSACQQVLSQSSRWAGCAQALLHPSTPVHLHCLCLSTRRHWPISFSRFTHVVHTNSKQAITPLFVEGVQEANVQFEAAPVLSLRCRDLRA